MVQKAVCGVTNLFWVAIITENSIFLSFVKKNSFFFSFYYSFIINELCVAVNGSELMDKLQRKNWKLIIATPDAVMQ